MNLRKYFLLAIIAISYNLIFAQSMSSNKQYENLEKKAIRTMQRNFSLPKNVELSALVLQECRDTTALYMDSPVNCSETYAIGDFLKNMKIIHSEVFVYDRSLKHVFVYNRELLGSGKFKKEYYLGNLRDRMIVSYLLQEKYDKVYNITHACPINAPCVLLCFKQQKMFLAYEENGMMKTISVTEKSIFGNLLSPQ